jgi:hypothetical protein
VGFVARPVTALFGRPGRFLLRAGCLALAAGLARGRAPLILVAFNLFANHGACLTTPRPTKQAGRELPAVCGRIAHAAAEPEFVGLVRRGWGSGRA